MLLLKPYTGSKPQLQLRDDRELGQDPEVLGYAVVKPYDGSAAPREVLLCGCDLPDGRGGDRGEGPDCVPAGEPAFRVPEDRVPAETPASMCGYF